MTPAACSRPAPRPCCTSGRTASAAGRRRRPGRVDGAAAADAGLRRDRLRGRGRQGRQLPRLPRHGVRRPADLRDAAPLPGRRRGRRRVAAPLPAGARGRADRRPDGDLRADPRPEVRRTPAGGGAARPAAYIGAMGSRRTHEDRLDGCTRPGSTRPAWPGWPRRSGWTSARAPRRRPPSRSRPRSCRPVGAGRVAARRDRRTDPPGDDLERGEPPETGAMVEGYAV